MTGPAPPDYFRAVERAFLELQGGAMFLPPADWDLVRGWEQRGIPLSMVLAGIRAAFSGRVRASSRMSLRDCEAAVEGAFNALRRRRAGAGVSPQDVEAPTERAGADLTDLERIAAHLGEWTPDSGMLSDPETAADLAAVAREAAERLQGIGKGADAGSSRVQGALKEIEDALLTHLETALAESARKEIEAEVRNTLDRHRARMPESTWREAFAAAVRRRVGKKAGLGPLTLFE